MERVVKINNEATERLMTEALPLLTAIAREFIDTVQVYATNHRRGRANWRTRLVRVPAWVFKDRVNFCGKGLVDGGPAFAAYYLAHELAHIKASSDKHGPRFMSALKELCPDYLQGYESIYKPKSAAAAGIESLNDDSENSDSHKITFQFPFNDEAKQLINNKKGITVNTTPISLLKDDLAIVAHHFTLAKSELESVSGRRFGLDAPLAIARDRANNPIPEYDALEAEVNRLQKIEAAAKSALLESEKTDGMVAALMTYAVSMTERPSDAWFRDFREQREKMWLADAALSIAINSQKPSFIEAQKPVAGHPSLIDDRDAKADNAFESYLFGYDTTVDMVDIIDCVAWNKDDKNDFTKIVYASYKDDPENSDSHKISFHVRFNDDGGVEDVYALEVKSGNNIGCRGDVPQEAELIKRKPSPRMR